MCACLLYAFGAGAAGAAPAAGTGAPGPPGTPAGRAAVSVAAFMECPLKERVKLNSPSLWPTMFSVMYTGMNFLPLCTAIVCPTISGMMVDRRDQVRSTFFSLREFIASTLVCRWLSMNGPFLVERAINSALSFQLSAIRLEHCWSLTIAHRPLTTGLLTLLASSHDECIGALVVARLVAARRLAPRGHRMAAAGSLAFAAAMRMIDGVHRNSTVMRTPTRPAHTPCLADRNVLVIGVTDLSDRRHAVLQDFPRFARRQLDQRVVAFLRHQLRRTAC